MPRSQKPHRNWTFLNSISELQQRDLCITTRGLPLQLLPRIHGTVWEKPMIYNEVMYTVTKSWWSSCSNLNLIICTLYAVVCSGTIVQYREHLLLYLMFYGIFVFCAYFNNDAANSWIQYPCIIYITRHIFSIHFLIMLFLGGEVWSQRWRLRGKTKT